MAERDETRGKTARGNFPASPACGQWETLLADALDGLLRPEDEAIFSTHMATCAACTEMFEEARRGREWLEFLSPEPEVPAYLLDRILSGTGPGDNATGRLAIAGAPNVMAMPPVWQQLSFSARVKRFAEPRLMMTAAMAFFSIALTLSMAGVRLDVVHIGDLRPANVRSALEKRIMTASTPLVRYYDHLRFVYEVESRMRELRRTSESQQDQQKPAGGEGQSHKRDGGSNLHPKDAPQQTVNPPMLPWSGNLVEARLESQPALPAVEEKAGAADRSPAAGWSSSRLGKSGLDAIGLLGAAESGREAVSEGSKPCSA
jgi:hypothetical protein